MKLLKYTLFLLIGGLLLAAHSFAQPGTRRMNISIGIFSPSATIYDYEGAIGVVGSTGYTVDDIEPGDMFWDDLSRYQVDSVEVIVVGSSATVWVTDLYGAGTPQSGKGTLGKPSPNLGLQPMTENGSNFITEAQEAKILTDNLNRMDSLAGDGNGIIDALPVGNVTIDGANNQLTIDDLNRFQLLNSDRITFDAYLFDWDTQSFRWDNVSPYLSRKFVFGSEYTHGLGFPPDEAEGRVAMRMAEGASFQAGDEVTLQFQNIASDPEVFIGHQDGLGFASLPGYNGSESLKTYNKIGGFTISDDGILIRGPGFLPGANVLAYDDNYEGRFDSLSVPHLGYIERNFAPIDASGDGNGLIDALPLGDVNINAATNDLTLTGINAFSLDTGFVVRPTAFSGSRVYFDIKENDYRFLQYPDGFGNGSFGFRAFASPTARSFYIGDVENDYNRTSITLFDHIKTIRAEGEYRVGFEVAGYVTTIGDFSLENDATLIELDATGDMTLQSYNNILFAGDGWSYTMPDDVPSANQVLGEGASDDDVLEWVDLPAPDGNGIYSGSGSVPAGTIVSAPGDGETFYLKTTSGIIDIGNTSGELIRVDADRDEITINSDNLELNTPTAIIGDVAGTGNSTKITVDDGGGNIKLGNPGSTWIQTAQGATSITASGVATGKVIVSGASSLPSSISHIEGADTSQVNVRAAGGIGLKSTKPIVLETTATVDIQSDTATMGTALLRSISGSTELQNTGTTGALSLITKPSLDAFGLKITGTPSARRVEIGDYESQYFETKLYIDDVNERVRLGTYATGFEFDAGEIRLGDYLYDDTGIGIFVDLPNDYVRLGDMFDEYANYISIEPANGIIKLQSDNLVQIGDIDGTNGVLLTLDVGNEIAALHANAGTTIEGDSYTYTLPVTTPTAADSLYRVMAWKQGVSSFQVMNGANYRTATASGNILPYDDYVEVDPNVTVHLPAPIAALKGKVFHIIAGGGTGGANPGTIDVVDGSSTIEVGSSLALDTAFESYSLVCNGSVWIVLNNKP